jgi:beta-lactamase superfamily II metal-dependent hydrolase
VFNVTMLPAAQGDCLWVEYGSEESLHRILIDCGTSPTYRRHLKRKLAELRPYPYVDLLIVTHIDTDHIGGVLKMLDAPPEGLRVGQIWFNAWRHVAHDSLDIMGPVDGEILSCQLDKLEWKWNSSFRSKDRSARLPQPGRRLPSYRLPGGMKLTVVSPTIEQLLILRDTWRTVVKEGGLAPGVPSQRLVDKARQKGVRLDLLGGDPIREWADSQTEDLDDTAANGSSIALVAEYEDDGVTKRCLLAGDAHGPVLAEGIRRLADQLGETRLRLDAFKLPHHGSLRNVTREVVEAVDCRRYLFSTNGVSHKHPHREAVARVIVYGTPGRTFHFNYRTKFNESWDDSGLRRQYDYGTEYGDGTLTVNI